MWKERPKTLNPGATDIDQLFPADTGIILQKWGATKKTKTNNHEYRIKIFAACHHPRCWRWRGWQWWEVTTTNHFVCCRHDHYYLTVYDIFTWGICFLLNKCGKGSVTVACSICRQYIHIHNQAPLKWINLYKHDSVDNTAILLCMPVRNEASLDSYNGDTRPLYQI